MGNDRRTKILEIISNETIQTQEELADRLNKEGYAVTQATVSRDIKQLNLIKVPVGDGRQKYARHAKMQEEVDEKYVNVLRNGFKSMDMAQNILVIKTISGMAMAVAASVDALDFPQIVGSIAGDDTVMCAVKTVSDTYRVMDEIERLIKMS
ncbi:MAG: arginine repressor [Lachnospiraceae bacterium]|nr:arginine repressor [Lachnospiraceae bacterium]